MKGVHGKAAYLNTPRCKAEKPKVYVEFIEAVEVDPELLTVAEALAMYPDLHPLKAIAADHRGIYGSSCRSPRP